MDISDWKEMETEVLVNRERFRTSQDQLRSLAARLQSARERERTAVARDLHDGLGQVLTNLTYDLSHLVTDLMKAGVSAKMVDRVRSLIAVVESAVGDIRRIATELRPAALDQLGLRAAIELETAAIQSRTGLRCRVTASRRLGPFHLEQEQATAVFRIFQEAMTNVIRHANASTVRIQLREDRGTFVMEVQDNGRGITRAEVADRASLGLLGMRERMEAIGGTVEITGQPGKGTKVAVRLPGHGRDASPARSVQRRPK